MMVRPPRLPRSLIALAIASLTFVFMVKYLSDALSGDMVPMNRREIMATSMPCQHRFVPVQIAAPMPTSAASGLVVVPGNGIHHWFLAVANFYGFSTLFSLDTSDPHLAPQKVQQFATKAAHDWEAWTLPDGRWQVAAAEYDAERSLVYEFVNASGRTSRPLVPWPSCADSDPAACAAWASSGECTRNPGFMRSSCAAACGLCAALGGPLYAVQALTGLGGTSVRHVRIPTAADSAADLLLVANYKAPAGEGIAAYEWRATDGEGSAAWHLAGQIDVPGAGEFAHCPIPQTGEQLLVVAAWYARGSFAASSWVLSLTYTNGAGGQGSIDAIEVQVLPTMGSHDAECFHREGETYLLLLSARRDDGSRDVPSTLYVYDWQHTRRFVEVQQLPTTGAHDAELLTVAQPAGRSPLSTAGASGGGGDDAGTLLAVVANGARWDASVQGDGEVCDAGALVYLWDDAVHRLIFHQRLNTSGCTTFARAWHAGERTLLAVAVERTASGSYDAGVEVYEWTLA